MKNKLSDLNNHLFAQMERLSDEDLEGDELKAELERSKAISGIAKDIVSNASLALKVQKAVWERDVDPGAVPPMLRDGKEVE